MAPKFNQISDEKVNWAFIFLTLISLGLAIITPEKAILSKIMFLSSAITFVLTAMYIRIKNDKKINKLFSHRFGDPKRCDLCYCKTKLNQCKNCGKILCEDCIMNHPKSIGMKCP